MAYRPTSSRRRGTPFHFGLLALIAYVFSAASSHAATYYNVTFEEPVHHAGQLPTLGGAPDKVTSFYSSTPDYSAQGAVYAPASIVPAPPGLSGQALKLLTAYPHLYLVFRSADFAAPATANPNLTLSFDLVTYGGVFQVSLPGGGQAAAVIFSGVDYTISLGAPRTMASKHVGSYSQGVMHVSIEVAPDLGLWIGKINGQERWREPYVGPKPTGLSFSTTWPFPGYTGEMDSFIDNVVIADTAEVNQAPSFTPGGDVVAPEDTVYSKQWATEVSAGDGETNQSLDFQVTNDKPALFTVQPAISPTGVLTFTPAPNAYGQASVTVRLRDTGGTLNGGFNATALQTFAIDVVNVNDPPTLDPIADFAVLPDSPERSVSLGGITVGPANETATLEITATSSDPTVIPTPQVVYTSPEATGALKFTPAPGASGYVTITVTVAETGSPGVQTSRAFVVKVTPDPTFTKGPSVQAQEDVPFSYAAWPTAVSIGAADPQDPLSYEVTTDNPALFSAPPAIAADGKLTFTSAQDAFGHANATVRLHAGSRVSDAQTFGIDIAPVNDTPTVTAPATFTVYDDQREKQFTITHITAGPPDEPQNVRVTVSAYTYDQYAGKITYPTVTYDASTGTAVAKFTPLHPTTVTFMFTVEETTLFGSNLSRTAYTTVTVLEDPNVQKPAFTGATDTITVAPNSGGYLQPWASNITNVHGANYTADLQFLVILPDGASSLFAMAPSITRDGVLSFTPAANAQGTVTVNVRVRDRWLDYADPLALSDLVPLTISIVPPPSAPSFTPGGNVTCSEDSGHYQSPWATRIKNSQGTTSTANLEFLVQNDNPVLFSSGPSVTADGVLSFQPADNANGTAQLSVTLRDNSQPAGGSARESATQSFSITVTPVNDLPTFLAGDSLQALRGSGPQVIPHWATGISAGPADEASQNLHFSIVVDHPEYFSVPPKLSTDGALTFTPASDKFGKAQLTIVLEDDGGGPTATATAYRTIEIPRAIVPLGAYRALVHAPVGDLPVDGSAPIPRPTANAQAGLVSLLVTPTGQFTGRLTLSAGRVFPLQGKFDGNGVALFGPAGKRSLPLSGGARPLVLQLQWFANETAPTLLGNLTRLDEVFAEITGGLAVFVTSGQPKAPFRNIPADLIGRYNLALSPAAPPAGQSSPYPKGHGYGTFTVSRTGSVTFVGHLPDNTVVTYSGPILGDLSLPLYAPIQDGRGSLSGFAQFRDVANVSDVDGQNLSWSSPRTSNWPAFDGVQVILTGAKYTGAGFVGLQPADHLDYHVHLALASPVEQDIQITNGLTPSMLGSALELRIDAETGLLTGSYQLQRAAKPLPFRGIILGKQSTAYGYIPGAARGEALVIAPR